MSGTIPNSYDMLSMYGVLPYDANEIITGTPSPYLQQNSIKLPGSTPKKDEFKHEKEHKEPLEPKKIGLIALGTYLTGVALSRSKNPLKGMKAIGKTLWNLIKLPIRVFKK